MWGMRVVGAALALSASAAPGPHHVTPTTSQTLPITTNQGVARVPHGWIVSGTNSPLPHTDILVRLDDNLTPVVTKPDAIPPAWRAKGYDHIGDVDVVGNVVYAPFEQPDYSRGSQATARYDATTLAFIDAVELPQHENSFVAVDPATMTAWTQDHFDGDTLVRYDIRAGWKPLPPLQLSRVLHKTQGAAVAAGGLWISTSDATNALWFVDTATGAVEAVGSLGHLPGEGEGIDASTVGTNSLHALVISGDLTSVIFQHFAVTTTSNVAAHPGLTVPAGGAATAGARSTGATSPSTGWDGRMVSWALLMLGAAVGGTALARRSSDAPAGEGEQPIGG